MNATLSRRALTVVIAACAVFVSPLSAQKAVRPAQGRAGNIARAGAQKPNRPVVDKLQQRVDNMVRKQLNLTDDQFTKLRQLNNRLDAEKRAQRLEEAEVRRALREELLPGVTPNDAKVAELVDKLPVVERKRIALQEREQKELATFMQPAQRARYFALQDEIRRSLQDVQRRRGLANDSVPGVLKPGVPPVRPPQR